MKKPFLILLLAFMASFTAFAGVPAPPSPLYTTDPIFLANELQIDIFGTHATTDINSLEGWGGGLGVNYFFTETLGLGVEGAYDGDNWSTAANVIMRAPIEALSIAPYVFGGIGWQFPDISGFDASDFEYHVGAGVDWRWTDTLGAFADWRYIFGDELPDTQELRIGLRAVF